MKKIFAFTLAMLMVFAMTACASSGTAAQPGPAATVAPTGTQAPAQTDPTGAIMDDPTGPIPETTEAVIPETTAPVIDEPVSGGFELGTVTGTTYVNSYIGLEFAGPEGFVYASYADIMTANGLDVDATLVELETMAGTTAVYVMEGATQDGTANVNVVVQRLSVEELKDADIKAAVEATMETVEGTYTAGGFANVEVKYNKFTVGTTAVDGLMISAEIAGLEYYGAMLQYIRDDLFVTVTAGAFDADVADSMLANSKIY